MVSNDRIFFYDEIENDYEILSDDEVIEFYEESEEEFSNHNLPICIFNLLNDKNIIYDCIDNFSISIYLTKDIKINITQSMIFIFNDHPSICLKIIDLSDPNNPISDNVKKLGYETQGKNINDITEVVKELNRLLEETCYIV